ncbi:MAG TPA: RsmB/NOP family class I SAM-dependent RNA methyltransferase, partial [Candidatus Saccharimonadales bacterium]|nr:RsmB/NOP family class I SAM-dependent RNA methyltransferase [Candidatus Saccharimonadales bacterium]
MKNALATVIEALSWMSYAGLGERTALFKAAEQIGVEDRNDLRHAHRLIMEINRYQNRLEYLLADLLTINSAEELPHGITSFLKILAYLKWIDGAEEKELKRAVFAARQILGWKELHPFESIISRIVSSSLSASQQQIEDEWQRTALFTCTPEWLVKRLTISFGRNFALRMLQRNLAGMPAYVRLNTLKLTSSSDAPDQLDRIGSRIRKEDIWKLNSSYELNQLSQRVVTGEVVVQDLASIVTSLIASPKPGDLVLDICAAPGNKTTHLAALMKNKGTIYSIDISVKRFVHWQKEMKRAGNEIAIPILADAANLPLRVKADVVLVDPPCSNTGVFARNPNLKWKISEAKMKLFVKRQLAILNAGSDHVRRNGSLVY